MSLERGYQGGGHMVVSETTDWGVPFVTSQKADFSKEKSDKVDCWLLHVLVNKQGCFETHHKKKVCKFWKL